MQNILRLSLLLIIAAIGGAGFTYTGLPAPNAANTFHYGAKVIMSTSAATTATIVWNTNGNTTTGQCGSGSQYFDTDGRGSVTDHVYVITTQVPANTLIHYQWCANDGTGVLPAGDQTFTTTPLPIPHPGTPALPSVAVPSTIPTQTGGNTYTFGTSCSTLTGCMAMLSHGSCPTCGDTLLIPHGTTIQDYCAGTNTGGNAGIQPCVTADSWAPGKGWITIRTDAADSSLPPPGVRIDPVAYQSQMASIENPYFYHNGYGETAAAKFCGPGTYLWASTFSANGGLNNAGWHMYQCQPYAWSNVSAISGTWANSDATITATFTIPNASGYSVGDTCYFDPVINGIYGPNSTGAAVATGTIASEGMAIPRVGGTCTVTAATSTTVTASFFGYWRVGQLYNNGLYPYTISGAGGRLRNFYWQQILCSGSCSGLPAGSSTPSVVLNPLTNIGTACSTLGQWGYDTVVSKTEGDWSNTDGPKYGVTSTGSVTRCVDSGWGATQSGGPAGYSAGTGNYKWARWSVALTGLANSGPISGNLAPALNLDAVSHIKIGPGIRLSYVNIPADPLFLDSASTTVIDVQGGKYAGSQVWTGPGSDHVIFDQVYLDGRGYPQGSGPNDVAYLNGSNIAIVNSYATGEDSIWIGAQDRRLNASISYDSYYNTVFVTSGVNGLLADNNYIQTCGIGWHFDDEWAPMMPTEDVTITRNTFYRDLACAYGSTANASARPEGVYGPIRHLLELKQGWRFNINGNTLTNAWRNVNSAAAIALTPRNDSTTSSAPPATVIASSNILVYQNPPASVVGPGLTTSDWVDCEDGQIHQVTAIYPTCGTVGCFTVASSPGISDGTHYCRSATFPGGVGNLTITNNTLSGIPNAYNIVGAEVKFGVGGTPPMVFPLPLQFLSSTNNVYSNIIDDGAHQDPGVKQGNGGGVIFKNVAYWTGDLTSSHDTIYNLVGGSAGGTGVFFNYSTVLGSDATEFAGNLAQNSEGIAFNNDIIGMGAVPGACTGCAATSPINDVTNSLAGTAMLNHYYTTANGPSVIGTNLFEMSGGNPGGYPGSVTWLNSLTQFAFFDSANNNFRLNYTSPGSSGAHLASDGLDVGADIDALEAAQGKVSNARVFGVGTTTASIGFIAPDTNGCTVDWDTVSLPGTSHRVSNSGGVRSQNVALTGLTTATTYYARINCAAVQPVVSFRTQ